MSEFAEVRWLISSTVDRVGLCTCAVGCLVSLYYLCFHQVVYLGIYTRYCIALTSPPVSKMSENQTTTDKDSRETSDEESLKTTDKDLTDLARFLTPQTWMALGRRLLSADDVMAIDADYQAVEEKSYQVLYRWRSRNCQSPLTDLLDAARNTGRLGQMCAEIKRRIKDRGGQGQCVTQIIQVVCVLHC